MLGKRGASRLPGQTKPSLCVLSRSTKSIMNSIEFTRRRCMAAASFLLLAAPLCLCGCISSSVVTKPIRASSHLGGTASVAPIKPPGKREVTIKSTTLVNDGIVSAPINLAVTWDDSDCVILRSSVVASLRAGGAFDSVGESGGDHVVAIRLDEAGITNMYAPTCHLKGEIVVSLAKGGPPLRRSFDISATVLSAASTAKNKAVEKLLAEVAVAIGSL